MRGGGRSRALRCSTRTSTTSPMLTTCWCLVAVPPLLAWWSGCVGDANAAITGEAATGNGVALADGDGEAAAREERGEQVVLIPHEDDDALAPGEEDRGAANVGGLYELYAALPPCGEGGGGWSGPSSYAVAGRAVLVNAVLRVVGELAELLHPLQDEVVHGAVVGLGLHAVEGVHGDQLGDLATDAVELPVFLGQQLTNVAYEVLSCVLHASISLAWLAGS
ncbi:hypothetical protein OsI_04324 [Oryza sativa Indica Group]|uniref:Uncharacterized protein n=1 Tax=Oryza sativa subsp. indica TaxID=39946 RepID=B8ABP3_ORYSI|nr:hypothetical protein OsI_04324 [Oryza sativa Indica Group]